MICHRSTKALGHGDVVLNRLLGRWRAQPDPVSICDEAAIIVPRFLPIYFRHPVPGHPAEITLEKVTFEAPAIVNRQAADKTVAKVMRPRPNDVDLPVQDTELAVSSYKGVSLVRIAVKQA